MTLQLHSAILIIKAMGEKCPSQLCGLDRTESDGTCIVDASLVLNNKRNITLQDGL